MAERPTTHVADSYWLTVCGLALGPGVAIVPTERQVTCGGCRMMLAGRADKSKTAVRRGRVTG